MCVRMYVVCTYVHVCPHACMSHTHCKLCNDAILPCFRVLLLQGLVPLSQHLHAHFMSSDVKVLQQGIMDEDVLFLWGQ